jgi:hypothetical protein
MGRVRCYLLERTEEVRREPYDCGVEGCQTHHAYEAPLWCDARTGALVTLDEAEPGAMWRWPAPDPSLAGAYTSQDDDPRVLMVKLPGGHFWCVDSYAGNCTRRGEPHHCWVREGVPPDVTAGKAGNTCSAGAGSIAVDGYHGFLRGGYLEEC